MIIIMHHPHHLIVGALTWMYLSDTVHLCLHTNTISNMSHHDFIAHRTSPIPSLAFAPKTWFLVQWMRSMHLDDSPSNQTACCRCVSRVLDAFGRCWCSLCMQPTTASMCSQTLPNLHDGRSHRTSTERRWCGGSPSGSCCSTSNPDDNAVRGHNLGDRKTAS